MRKDEGEGERVIERERERERVLVSSVSHRPYAHRKVFMRVCARACVCRCTVLLVVCMFLGLIFSLARIVRF